MLTNIPIAAYACMVYYLSQRTDCTTHECSAFLYKIPLLAAVLSLMSSIPQKLKLSTLFDSHGRPLTNHSSLKKRRRLFLPQPSFQKHQYTVIRETLVKEQQQISQETNDATSENGYEAASWALVTGASGGIGRDIAISLARRNVPVVLVARRVDQLKLLSKDIMDCYGVRTVVIRCDLCDQGDIMNLINVLSKKDIAVDIFIHNAGVGDTGDFVDSSPQTQNRILGVNVQATTKLLSHFGSQMKNRGKGRIVLVGSLTGAMPGIPTAAIYAASKAYQRSFAASLGRELESYGVGVTCVLPGAVLETDFQSRAKMDHSSIFSFPIGLLTPKQVAECTVRSMISGRHEVFIGWMNVLMGKWMTILLPPRLLMLLCEFVWRPFPSLRTIVFGKKEKNLNVVESKHIPIKS